jgi:hypothetical protein
MNKKSLEALQTELATIQKRRDEIAADLETAAAEVKAATAAMIDGGDASRLTQSSANRAALNSAFKELENQIATSEESLEAAREDFKKESALKATAAAIEEYDTATLAFQNALREFMASHENGDSVMQAASSVRRCENNEFRADLRSRVKPRALEYSRPCGNAELIINQLRNHIEGKKYASDPAVTGAAQTTFSSGFSKAGISVSSGNDHGSPELHRAGIR